MQSHKAKLMPNTLHFFHQSKEMYDIDFTNDKAPFSTVSKILWNIENADFTVLKACLVVHSVMNPYYWRLGIKQAVRNVYHVIYKNPLYFFCHWKYGIDLT